MLLKNFLYASLLVVLSTLFLLTGCDSQDSTASVTPTESEQQAADDSVIEHARKHADPTYVCPMHPQIVRGEPGSCPICGMDLELQEVSTPAEGSGEFGPPIITIRPETLQNMGMRTAPVERDDLSRRIETVGYVAYDEDRISHVHPRASGWVEELFVRAEGDVVKQGEPLLSFYSPNIVTAQEEYLLALNGVKTSSTPRGRDMLQAAQRRLRLLDIPKSVMDNLAKTRQVQEAIPILAPTSGVITELGIREGMYIKPEMELFAISDISSVWVEADVFEHQMDWVEPGNPAAIQVPALPGRTWKGKVDYIYPELDAKTQTLRVRLRFPNTDGALKPNMYAQTRIASRPKENVLTIPREALIVSGGEDRVVVALGDGRFQPKTVAPGMHAGDRLEILEGLQEGDIVVVSGQFLVDSESNLQASFRRMTAPSETQQSTHQD
jgi:Cu(I)/Ag(I) efflux system membrane fusion protein